MKTIRLIKRFVIGLLLLLISLVFIRYLWWLGITTIFIRYIYKRRFWKGLSKIGDIFKIIATSIDKIGCVLFQVIFNKYFITIDGYKFGNPDDTISRVLGLNKQSGTIRKLGKALCAILGWMDKNHCINSI